MEEVRHEAQEDDGEVVEELELGLSLSKEVLLTLGEAYRMLTKLSHFCMQHNILEVNKLYSDFVQPQTVLRQVYLDSFSQTSLYSYFTSYK